MYLTYNIDILIDYGDRNLTMWSYLVRFEWVFVLYVQVKSGTIDEEIKNYNNLLKEHRESQVLERSKATMHHRQKALQSTERYNCHTF